MVEVRVYGLLWEHLEPRFELDLAGQDLNVGDLVARLNINPVELGIVTVDGRQSKMDAPVPDGSRVCIFAPMSGG
jgi:molybdopterin converting factor small subunit